MKKDPHRRAMSTSTATALALTVFALLSSCGSDGESSAGPSLPTTDAGTDASVADGAGDVGAAGAGGGVAEGGVDASDDAPGAEASADAELEDGTAPASCGTPGPVWDDVQSMNVGAQSAAGQTGQWWCDNHFGKNLGGAWQCIDSTGGCGADTPQQGTVTCGRLGADGATPYCGHGQSAGAFGYGRVESVLVTQSAPGQTGQWWCTNHLGNNLGGSWKCRGVSGGGACGSTVPNGELVSCSRYDDVQTVTVTAPGAGQTGQWWCDHHFGVNLGGTWDCVGVSSGGCGQDVAAGGEVTCGRFGAVDESPFAPVACTSSELDGPEHDFCAYTEYMTTRAASAFYVYNDWVRAGMARSFGGALFELYGTDKRNRIEEHGGAAVQLSVWGYDVASSGAGYFTTTVCNPNAFSDAGACAAANGGAACSYYAATGAHICDCSSVLPCGTWTAGGPWNPIQAQAANCGWNGPTNDVSSVQQTADGLVLQQVNPYHFSKTTAFEGMTWSVAALAPPERPYVRLRYRMTWNGAIGVGEHNQEIPAIFADNRIGGWYYYYAGDKPYADLTGPVTRLRADFGSELALPGRPAPLPQPEPANLRKGTEEWMSVCDGDEGQCLTVVSFAPVVKAFVQGAHYVTALGRFGLGTTWDDAWDVYLFPYRFDQVVAGKTIREWVYVLRAES